MPRVVHQEESPYPPVHLAPSRPFGLRAHCHAFILGRVNRLVANLQEALLIPLAASRLAARHLPTLVTIVCLGLAARQGIIWLAVWSSTSNALVPTLLMPLAPLAVMVSLIVSLWLLFPSLSFLSATFSNPRQSESRSVRLLSIGGLLIPFLTVYVTHGLLKEDLAQYRYSATTDEALNQGFNADFSRAFIDNTGILIGLVVVTVILRKLIGYFALGEKNVGLASLSAYLEVLWMGTVSVLLTNSLTRAEEWLTSRAVIAPAYREFLSLKSEATQRGSILVTAWDWAVENLPKLSELVAVPIAWLTLGAVVYGTTLVGSAASAGSGTSGAADAAPTRSRRWRREAQSAAENALSPVLGPLRTVWGGIVTLSRAGLLPMLLFCVVFIFASLVELTVVWAARAIVGPQDSLAAAALSPYILIVARLVYFITAMCLLAAALNFFLERTYQSVVDDAEAAGTPRTAEAVAAQAAIDEAADVAVATDTVDQPDDADDANREVAD